MVQISNVLMALLAASSVTSALAADKPIRARIAASTRPWKRACRKAHGGPWCHAFSKAASLSLRSCSAPCEQQDAADMMVDLAKTLNSTDMIELSLLFAQQPRNSIDGLQVPYCQKAPRNAELLGFYPCQFSGTGSTEFSGNLSSLPLGVTAVAPPGSCPAYNSSVPDGMQLYDLVTSPGTPGTPINNSTLIASRDEIDETFTQGCDPDYDDDDDYYPDSGAFHSNGTNPTLDTSNMNLLGSNNVSTTSSGNDATTSNMTSLFSNLLGSSSNTSTSSTVDNGTATPDITSLFSNLSSSSNSSTVQTPGNILRRAGMPGVRDTKPEHIQSKSRRVKRRPKQERNQVKLTRSGRKRYNKRGKSEHDGGDKPEFGYENPKFGHDQPKFGYEKVGGMA